MICRTAFAALMCLASSLAAMAQTSRPAAVASNVLLDQNSPLRRYYRFSPNRISPALLKAEGLKILGQNRYDRLRQMTQKWFEARGKPAPGEDWCDHAVLAAPGARAFNPKLAPPPPQDWTAASFDDSQWPRLRTVFQGCPAAGITAPNLGQYDESVDLKLHQAFYRGRFVLAEPKTAGKLSLNLIYAGGVRVFLNGIEIARGHLPGSPGAELPADEPAQDYPPAAYAKDGERLSHRTLDPVALPEEHLRSGVNVLAVELRASCLHPVVLINPDQPNWGGPMRPWPHARLVKLELRGSNALAAWRSVGVQGWAEDMHNRTLSSDLPAPGEPAGAVVLVGARNGAYSGQLVVRSERMLASVQVTCGGLKSAASGQAIPVRIAPMIGYPLSQWTMKRLGDERGLDAGFPTRQQLAQYAASTGEVLLFDQISSAAGAVSLPAEAARPFWLQVSVPKDAQAGKYAGTVEVVSAGNVLASLPVQLEVLDWSLPAPEEFKTLVGCEENPYAVARQYNVKPWSAEHFKLLEASFRQLGRIGNAWLNVPVLTKTELGNLDDSPIRWTLKAPSAGSGQADGTYEFDYSILDKCLDVAAKHCRTPRVVQFMVMHGMKPAAMSAAPEVLVQTASGPRRLVLSDADTPEPRKAWTAFATSLVAHMKSRGLDKAMYWGAPWEGEADPTLKKVLAEAVPGVYWTAGPHEMMSNGTFAKDEKYYHLVTDIRYHGGWPSFRDDMGWKSKTIHLLNPRVGGTAYAMHTTSHPFGYRVMVERALALGRSGFSRVGADDWAGTHYLGITLPKWLTGMPVLFTLWPGAAGAESSARFEALLEGVQETEARIFLEQALDAHKLPAELAAKVKAGLAQRFDQTNICQGNSIIHSLEQYHCSWQQRSAELYQLAAQAGK